MSTSLSRDPDIISSLKALRRAGRAARKLSIATGTPFYVWKDGKVVDLNKPAKRPKSSVLRAAQRKPIKRPLSSQS